RNRPSCGRGWRSAPSRSAGRRGHPAGSGQGPVDCHPAHNVPANAPPLQASTSPRAPSPGSVPTANADGRRSSMAVIWPDIRRIDKKKLRQPGGCSHRFATPSPGQRIGLHRGHELDRFDDALLDAEAAVLDAAKGTEFEAVTGDFVDVD